MTQPSQPAAQERIARLQERLDRLERERHSLQGRILNRDPARLETLQTMNAGLKARVNRLEHALFALLGDSLLPRRGADEKLQCENLRKTTVEYCRKSETDPELWKNLVS